MDIYIGDIKDLAEGKKGWLVGVFRKGNRNLSSKNVEFTTERSYGPGETEKEHVHDKATEYWEVTEGAVTIYCKDKPPRDLSAGQLMVVPKKTAVGWMTKEGFKVRIIKSPSVLNDKRYV